MEDLRKFYVLRKESGERETLERRQLRECVFQGGRREGSRVQFFSPALEGWHLTFSLENSQTRMQLNIYIQNLNKKLGMEPSPDSIGSIKVGWDTCGNWRNSYFREASRTHVKGLAQSRSCLPLSWGEGKNQGWYKQDSTVGSRTWVHGNPGTTNSQSSQRPDSEVNR